MGTAAKDVRGLHRNPGEIRMDIISDFSVYLAGAYSRDWMQSRRLAPLQN